MELSYIICIFFFLVFPPGLLLWRFKNQKPGWWVIALSITILGWVSLLGSFIFYESHISELISQNLEPPSGWDKRGASGLLIVFCGWLLPMLYSLPWLGLYLLCTLVKNRLLAIKSI